MSDSISPSQISLSSDHELNALIDQKFFNNLRFLQNNTIDMAGCPNYTQDISATWRLVEKLYEIGYLVEITQVFQEGFEGNKAYRCMLQAYNLARISENAGRDLIVAVSNVAQKAIVMCAVKALEINHLSVEARKKALENV